MAAATCTAEVPLELGGLGKQQDRSDSGTS